MPTNMAAMTSNENQKSASTILGERTSAQLLLFSYYLISLYQVLCLKNYIAVSNITSG